ncbi:MAG TPA: penicillin acylase family protein [Mycobacteriales bacterium]|nr:penicillin acylase family protein [Mycobacteriales bacterium]
MRRTTALAMVALAAAVAPATGAGATAGWTPPRPTYRLHDVADGDARQILPAGENGLVNATQLVRYEATGTRPVGSADQQTPYTSLLFHDRSLTNRQLSSYFVDNSFGIRTGKVERTERPDPSVDVVIYRGPHDIPHIYGATLEAMAYGAGYAAAEDRLFFMDVLRHYGEGDLSSFVGPSCGFEDMDHDQLLAAGYSKTQLAAQLSALPKEYGRSGRNVVDMISSYVAGINRYIARSRTNPSLLPADYAAVDGVPQNWSPEDVVATASLIGTEATAGGNELAAAGLLRYLEHRLGEAPGRRAFDAFKSDNDPTAPTTIRRRFAEGEPSRVNRALTAIPDHPLAPLRGTPTDTTNGCDLSRSPLQRNLAGLLRAGDGASNALLVSRQLSRDGNPLAVFGPELGYYAPQVLMEEDLHAPGYDAAGSAFPGASFVVAIGRGRSFAWSATTASTDQNDIRVERLCNPTGGPVGSTQHDYLYRGQCRAMVARRFDEVGITKAGGPGTPVAIDHQLYFARDGVVDGWTTLGGRPVAIVTQRSTFMHEADSFVGLLRWGQPALTHGPRSFIRNAASISYSFNWMYVGHRHIAYVVSGRDPVRDPHADPDLPTWGTGRAAWRGSLPAADHPHQIDPPSNVLMSWNNKPAPGFTASDDMYGWGPVHRVQLIAKQLHTQRKRHGKLTRANLVTAVEEAATEDLTGVSVLPPLLRYLGRTQGRVHALTSRLRSWVARGAHRRSKHPHDRQYAYAPAIAIWDQAYPLVVRALFDKLFAAGGVSQVDGLASAYRVLPMEFALTPNGDGTHHGDGYYVGWEGYVVRALRQLSGATLRDPFPNAVFTRLCGGPSHCRTAIERALTEAATELARVNETTKIRHWTSDTATATQHTTMRGYDRIVYTAAGIVSEPDMEWVNRPTYQQVVEFPAR